MIIREHPSHFICIEQNHHAHLAYEIMSHWQYVFMKNDPYVDSVLYAVKHHDIGWDYFDREPLWNDKMNQPYTFIDLPLLIKTVLYTYGVDLVETKNAYAGALCSAHYTKFLNKYDTPEVQQYIKKEEMRRNNFFQSYPEIEHEIFLRHLNLLQLGDHVSLFICLHESGNNEERHRYFAKGIPLGNLIEGFKQSVLEPFWLDEKTIVFKNLPKVKSFSITIKEKIISKNHIKEKGFLQTYKETPYSDRIIWFK